MTNAEARFNKSLRPRKPEGSLGRTAQDVHLDSHTAPELCPASAAVQDFEVGCGGRGLVVKHPQAGGMGGRGGNCSF